MIGLGHVIAHARVLIEHRTGWSIKHFITTVRRYRTLQIQAGEHTLSAADSILDDFTLDALQGSH